MPDPTEPTALIRLLGMVTYLDKFCQNLAGLTRPLRDLLKGNAACVWESPRGAGQVEIGHVVFACSAFI